MLGRFARNAVIAAVPLLPISWPAGAEETKVEVVLAVEHLQQAGASCYAVANGLTGDPARKAEGGEVVIEYLERQRASVASCRAACAEASELVEQVELDPAEGRAVVQRYRDAVQGLCEAAVTEAPTVQAYGRRVADASYDVALAEAEVSRRLEIETEDAPSPAPPAPPEEVAVPTEVEAPAPETEETAAPEPTAGAEPAPAPPGPKAEPAPSTGPGAAYWDPKRKEELLREEKRAEEIRRIQEEREQRRREQREARMRARKEQARREMLSWHAEYRSRTEAARTTMKKVRDRLEGRGGGRLRDLCQALDREVRAVLLDETAFVSPDDELSRLLEGSYFQYRALASDCLLGRTQTLGRYLASADEQLARAAERLAPYSLTP